MSSSPIGTGSGEVTSIKDGPLDQFRSNLIGYIQLYLDYQSGLYDEFMQEMYESIKRSNIGIKLEVLAQSLDLIKSVRSEGNCHEINQDTQSVLSKSVHKFSGFSDSPDYFLNIFNDFSYAIARYAKGLIRRSIAGRSSLGVVHEESGSEATLSATSRVSLPAFNRSNIAVVDHVDQSVLPSDSQELSPPPEARHDQSMDWEAVARSKSPKRGFENRSSIAAASIDVAEPGSSYFGHEGANYKTRYPLPNTEEVRVDSHKSIRKAKKTSNQEGAKTLEQEALEIYSNHRLTGWTKYDKTYHHQAGSVVKKRGLTNPTSKLGDATKDQQQFLRLYGAKRLPPWHLRHGGIATHGSGSLSGKSLGQSSGFSDSRQGPTRTLQTELSTTRLSRRGVISHTYLTGGGR